MACVVEIAELTTNTVCTRGITPGAESTCSISDSDLCNPQDKRLNLYAGNRDGYAAAAASHYCVAMRIDEHEHANDAAAASSSVL